MSLTLVVGTAFSGSKAVTRMYAISDEGRFYTVFDCDAETEFQARMKGIIASVEKVKDSGETNIILVQSDLNISRILRDRVMNAVMPADRDLLSKFLALKVVSGLTISIRDIETGRETKLSQALASCTERAKIRLESLIRENDGHNCNHN